MKHQRAAWRARRGDIDRIGAFGGLGGLTACNHTAIRTEEGVPDLPMSVDGYGLSFNFTATVKGRIIAGFHLGRAIDRCGGNRSFAEASELVGREQVVGEALQGDGDLAVVSTLSM